MTTARETALLALDTLLKTTLEGVAPPVVYLARNGGIEHKIEAGDEDDITVSGPARVFAGLQDGEAGQPAPLLGGDIYDHVQEPLLELAALHPDADKRDAALDAALAAIDAAIAADPVLGGACNFYQADPPVFSTIGEASAPMGKAAEVGFNVLFTSESPLG